MAQPCGRSLFSLIHLLSFSLPFSLFKSTKFIGAKLLGIFGKYQELIFVHTQIYQLHGERMGREKMKMKKIVDVAARQVTFCKRRKGLFKKASELSVLCDAQVGTIVFSPAGRLHHYASSNMEDILNKFSSHMDNERHRATFQEKNKNSCVNLSNRIEDDMDPLRGIEELQQLEMKLEAILEQVTARKEFQKEHSIFDSAEIRHCGQETIPGPITHEGSICLPYSRTTANLSAPETWIPPPPDIYKVNFAGAIFQEIKASGIGIIFRNWRGEFMAALAKFFPEQMDENATSSMAAKSAVEFAVDYHFTHVILEGDAHDIIKTLENSDHEFPADLPAFSYGVLLEAKRFIPQLDFCTFSHVRKSGNVAAHMVAQHAINVEDEVVWLMKEPEFLAGILLADAVHLNS